MCRAGTRARGGVRVRVRVRVRIRVGVRVRVRGRTNFESRLLGLGLGLGPADGGYYASDSGQPHNCNGNQTSPLGHTHPCTHDSM